MEDPPEPPPQPSPDVELAATRVAQIVGAAEKAAEALRASAEQRALERIAEADRAAEMRVQAAEDEAAEVRAEVAAEAEQLRAAAAETAADDRHRAQAEARDLLAEARVAARDVLREGEELSGNLRELSDALRTNAEHLMRDIRQIHAEMTARLDRAHPDPATPDSRPPPAGEDLDVPEFIPRTERFRRGAN